ncbi:MAG TPA: class I SAM-dependent methyltransferase family protein, partial [Methanobacterium sp.]
MMGLKIPKKQADQVRRILLKHSLIDLEWKIKRTDEYVYLPLAGKPGVNVIEEMGLSQVEIVDTDFEPHKKGPNSLKSYLEGRVSHLKMVDIKKSFDIIGDVVILEIPEELES